jgi:RTX calcium-binding nonapeptide repeat (4 copies)
MRGLWTATAVLAALLALAAPAPAATVRVAEHVGKYDFTGRSHLWVEAAAGEQNDIRVRGSGEDIVVSDSTALTAGNGCISLADGSVLCRPLPTRPWSAGHVELGDLADSAGGDFGGGADDLFLEGSRLNGADVISGGGNPGHHIPDPLVDRDLVSYADRRRPVGIAIGRVRNAGGRAEHDTIGSDVEAVIGGRGDDELTGSSGSDYLDGGHGDDVLRGLAGGDYLYGNRGADYIYDGPGVDRVRAGPGADRIRSGRSPDDVVGGPGNDRIWTRDEPAEGESIDCGGGFDRVVLDRFDQLTSECERRLRPR